MESGGRDEIVAVYDRSGSVIGTAPRLQVYAEGLWHASSGVLLRSTDGQRVYVHRRTTTKTVFPGMHDCLAGGVVDPGETPESTAIRELGEELGITASGLRPLSSVSWNGSWNGKPLRCHLFAFEFRHDGPVRHQASEISDGWWWTDRELISHLDDPEWDFVPDTRILVPAILRTES